MCSLQEGSPQWRMSERSGAASTIGTCRGRKMAKMLWLQRYGGAQHWMQPYHVSIIPMPVCYASDLYVVYRCKCSAQFCYTCGVQWKNCTCDIWEERNLLLRAEQVVDREADHPMAAPERYRRVVEIRQELQENHECNHSGR
jgi:hypothetical protein